MKRTQRSTWTFVSSLAYLVLTSSVALITTPLLLAWLGRDRYGAWRVMIDAFAYLGLLDLGFGGAMLGLLAPALGNGDTESVRRILASSLAIYRTITLAMLAVGAVLVILLPSLISGLDSAELRLAGVIVLLPFLWTFGTVYRSLAEARQQGYLVHWLLIAQFICITALSLLGAKLDWRLPGQAAANSVGLLVPAAVLCWRGFRAYPPASGSGIETRRALWKLNWPTLIFNISGRAGLLSDNIVVGWAMGPAAVAPFYLTQRLVSLAQLQLQGIGNSTWAALVELHARGDTDTFRSRLIELTGLVSGLGMAILLPLAAYNRSFVQHWIGTAAYAGEAVTMLATANAWIWSITSLWGWPLSGTGKIGAWAPYSVAFLLVNVALSVAVTLEAGIVGPLVGTLVAFLSITFWGMPRVLAKEFGIDPRSLQLVALQPLAWGLPYGAILWWIARSHAVTTWAALGAEIAAGMVGGVLIWWLTGPSPAERALWKTRAIFLLSDFQRSVRQRSAVAG